jgi:hypothetical protein
MRGPRGRSPVHHPDAPVPVGAPITTTTISPTRGGMMTTFFRAMCFAAALAAHGWAASPAHAQMFAQPDRDPRVNLRFDRYYDYDDMTRALQQLQRAYPRFLTLQSIGRSVEGRDIWLMIINNPATGPHTEKSAFWADANIHGNEIQGTEVNLYLIWFLMENYDALPRVREIVDSRAFYIVPSMNPDARENWTYFLLLRNALLKAGTIEGGYLDLVRSGRRVPVIFLNQLAQLILRNALDGCSDVPTLRAAEMMFRAQRGHVQDGSLILADDELVQTMEAELQAAPLTAMFSGGVDSLDVLNETNGWTYWSRSDAHAMAFNFGGDPAARAGLASAMTAFLNHLMGLRVTITPLTSVGDAPFHWFVGLDQVGTRIGNALWRGEPPLETMIGLFRLEFEDLDLVRPDVAGHPVWLILGIGHDMTVRMKPQNLVMGLPLSMEPTRH